MAKSDVNVSGSFTLEIDPEKTEACLLFESGGPDDKAWTMSEIMPLLQSAGVSAKPDEVARALQGAFQKKEKKYRVPVAKGTPPVSPAPESFNILDLDVPAALAEAVQKTLAEAGAPQIFREVQVKVERERLVSKKGPLPFMPERQERVKVVEKETRQEKVYVDPTPVGRAYVAAPQKIAFLTPARQGAPGKRVTGEMIPPEQLEDPAFHHGANVERKGNDLFALCGGVVRYGGNWVDVVPFGEHRWSLSQSDDKATCFLDYSPGSRHLPPVPAKAILEAALKLEHQTQDLLAESELDALIAEANELGRAIERRPISQSQDAFIDILVSEDKLKAVLNVAKGSGHGKALVLKDLGKAINESKLAIDKEKIKTEIPAWFKGPEKSLIAYVLAEGKVPQEPPPQSAAFSVQFLAGKELEQLKAQFATIPLENAASFPRDRIADIARVEKEQRVLSLGPAVVGAGGADVYGNPLPGKPAKPFELQLFGNLELVGSNLVVAKQAGLLLKAERDGKTYLAAFEHADAELSVEVADDAMAAWLSVVAHRGTGQAAGRDALLAAIAKAGVVKGIEQEVVDKAAAAAAAGQDISRLCFARGQAPSGGRPSEVRFLVSFASGQSVTLRADGTADFRNQDKLTTVRKDSPLAEILPPTGQATPGFTVLGKELGAAAQAALPLEIGANIRQQTQDDGKILLVADADGELRKDKNRLEIAASYTLKGNVDAASGNIKFPGTVQIAGDVMGGFYVMAGGDIKVAGSVEGALLSSDQDIFIQSGVKGAGKAVLRSKRHIGSGFIELATVLAVGDLRVKKALIRSKVKCNGKVVLADDGHVMGGEVKVKQGLVTGDLGNASGLATKVFFGQDILVEDQIEVENKEIGKLQEDLGKINTAMKSSEKISNKEQMQHLFNEKVRLMKLLEKRNLRVFTLKERFEQHFESEIVVKGSVFPGVVLESHGRTHEIHRTTKGVRFRFDTGSGRIVEEPLSKT